MYPMSARQKAAMRASAMTMKTGKALLYFWLGRGMAEMVGEGMEDDDDNAGGGVEVGRGDEEERRRKVMLVVVDFEKVERCE